MIYLLSELRPLQGRYALTRMGHGQLPDFVVLDAPAHWEMRDVEGLLQVKGETGWATFATVVVVTWTWPVMFLALMERWKALSQRVVCVIGPMDTCVSDRAEAQAPRE